MTKHVLLFLIVMSILLAGCQSKAVNGEIVEVTGGSYQNVTPDGLNTMLKDKDFVLINVHIPFVGNITGTDISIPYDAIEQNLSQLPAKEAKIVLYCRSGRMSQIAAEKLVSLGYTNIWNLSGGMVEWEQTGLDLEQ
jgi:rhodanese-related sulfurtransferase